MSTTVLVHIDVLWLVVRRYSLLIKILCILTFFWSICLVFSCTAEPLLIVKFEDLATASSELWRCVFGRVVPDVSTDYGAFISSVKQSNKNKIKFHMTLSQTCSWGVVGNQASRSFRVGADVRQGDSLSATRFNLALRSAIQDIQLQGNIVNRITQFLAMQTTFFLES
jgi:hypothetical protein